jgi:hypothetical protein
VSIRPRIAASLCTLLLIASAVLSAAAIHGKCATYDEPVHLVEGWEGLHHGDYRLEVTNPTLWKYWAAIPLPPDSFTAHLDPSEPRANDFVGYPNAFSTHALYAESNHRADELLFRARLMMLAFDLALGALVAVWAWQLAGPFAAIAATFLLALDPNFLAHAPLVKNDVPAASVFFLAAYTLWLIGRRITTLRVLAMGLILGAALCIKLSALLLAPIVPLSLCLRAMAPAAWPARGRSISSRFQRAGVAVGLCLVWITLAAAVIWGSYRFRFAASPDPRAQSTLHLFAAIAPQQTPLLVKAALLAADHHLLPEAWLTDVVSMQLVTSQRESFLMNEFSTHGWWYYFPLAFLFKTPLATLAACGFAAAGLLKFSWENRRATSDRWWTITCVSLPPLIYLIAAMTSDLDIGLRHLLPIYPFLFLAIGVAFSRWRTRRPRAAGWIGVTLALGLAAESLTAFPNFIPFFNLAAGGSRGGLSLLSDSNLDWGQDLPVLADWQRQHQDTPLYLCYFGSVPPAYYGIHYLNLAGSYAPDTPGSQAIRQGQPMAPGVIAISATQLQGTYLTPVLRAAYQPLQDQTPIAVLGGSIYLYSVK